jgi:hypothetical protein
MKTAAQINAGQVGESELKLDPKTDILLRFFAERGIKVKTAKVKGWERKPTRKKKLQ